MWGWGLTAVTAAAVIAIAIYDYILLPLMGNRVVEEVPFPVERVQTDHRIMLSDGVVK